MPHLAQVVVRLGPLRIYLNGLLERGLGPRILSARAEREPQVVVGFYVVFVKTQSLVKSVRGVGPTPQLRVDVAEAVVCVAVRRVESHGPLEGARRLRQTPFEREPRAVTVIDIRAVGVALR